jgi:hypothetical protein
MHNPSYNSVNGNINLGNAQLAEGTNAGTIKTVQAIDFMIGELLYSKAITDNIAVTAGAVQAAGTTAIYLISINSSGTVTTTKGGEQVTGSGLAMLWPSIPANNAVIGALKVANATNPFTAGTTDLSAAGVTATFYNLMTMPSFTLLA